MKKRIWGFTLIELIIVIVIIGILAVIAIPKYFTNIDKARKAEALSTMGAIRDAEQAYWAASNPGAYSTSFPISADIDKDGTNDVTVVQPVSTSYTYSIGGTGSTAYVIATTSVGGTSFTMCIGSGAVATGIAAPTCS